jgi:hypothetical protein
MNLTLKLDVHCNYCKVKTQANYADIDMIMHLLINCHKSVRAVWDVLEQLDI